MIGHSGAFANDAARICGGENSLGQQDICYQLDLKQNSWIKMRPKLMQKRSWAEAIPDDDGEMWLIGGQNDKNAIFETEKFLFQDQKWVKGANLPAELQDSGIEGHCIIKINATSIFIIGGYVPPFEFVNEFFEETQQQDTSCEYYCDYVEEYEIDLGILGEKILCFTIFEFGALFSNTYVFRTCSRRRF